MRRFHVSLVWLAVLASACRTSDPRGEPAPTGTSTGTTPDATAMPALPILHAAPAQPAKPAEPAAAAQPSSIPAVPLLRPGAAAPTPSPSPDAPTPTTRAGRAEALIAEHVRLREAYEANFRGVKTAEEYQEIAGRVKAADYGPVIEGMWALVDEAPADDASFRVLAWMLNEGVPYPRVVEELAQHHAGREAIGPLCDALVRGEEGHQGFVAELARSSPHASVRGLAAHALTSELKDRIEMARELQATKDEAELAQWKEWIGAARLAELREVDTAALERKLLDELRAIARDHGDVKTRRGTLGQAVASEIFELENLSIGKVAPEIVGEDVAGVPMKLTDFRGKVVVLDFWGNW